MWPSAGADLAVVRGKAREYGISIDCCTIEALQLAITAIDDRTQVTAGTSNAGPSNAAGAAEEMEERSDAAPTIGTQINVVDF